jgi:maleate cis-trans isomerase
VTSPLEYGSRGLIGVLTPQANTTVEPEFWALLPPGVAAVNARLTSGCATIEERLVDYFDRLEDFVDQFGNAPLGALAVACTGSSYLAGREREARLLERLTARLRLPVFTAATAVVDALHQLKARRIGLASPYPAALTEASIGYWRSQGFEVSAVQGAEMSGGSFHPIYSISAASAGATLESLARTDVDAILMLGTGMPTLAPILARANQGGPPVLSCMLALAWRGVSAVDAQYTDLAPWLAGRHWGARLALMTAPPDAV